MVILLNVLVGTVYHYLHKMKQHQNFSFSIWQADENRHKSTFKSIVNIQLIVTIVKSMFRDIIQS